MFRVSRRLDYGLHLLHALAQQPGESLTPTAKLSKELNIPLPFMHQIAHSLMQAGIIHAVPGPRGGLRLNGNPEKITILDIALILEGEIQLSPCAEQSQDSHQTENCITRKVWDSLQNEIIEKLKNVTLSALDSVE
jgi:Rrf2 family protein